MDLNKLLQRNENCLDLIRLVAALAVIVGHAFPLSGGQVSIDPVVRLTNNQESLGGLGVAAFFMVSGFLIPASWVRSQSALQFTVSRILRIYPALIVVVGVSSFVLGPLLTTLPLADYFASPLVYHYLETASLTRIQYFLPGVFEGNSYPGSVNGSLWTLPVELACYLLVMILGIAGLIRARIIAGLFVSALTLKLTAVDHYYLLRYGYGIDVLEKAHETIANPVLLQAYVPFLCFLGGTLMYIYKDRVESSWSGVTVCAAVIILSCRFGVGLDYALPIFGPYLILSLATSVRPSSTIRFADYSYGLYIFAFPVQQSLVQLWGGSMPTWLNVGLAVPITFTLAVLSWHFVEKPAMALKRFGKRQNAQSPDLVAS